MSNDGARPLVVQSDGTLLLEVHHDTAQNLREPLAAIAHLEKSPEYFHEYRLSSISLWNAAQSGWDADKVIGTWYGENVTAKSKGHVEWDMYFLYGTSSEWKEEGPTDEISRGRTIVNSRKQLQEDLLKVLGVAP